MEIEIEEIDLIQKAKDLYFKSKFKECISYVEENDVHLSFENHYILQTYRGFSFFEFCNSQSAFECFDNIFEERSRKRGKNISEIDVIIRAQFQLQVLIYCTQKAEQSNEILHEETNEYQTQHSNSEDYDEGVYRFGMGTYLLVDTLREAERNPLIYEYLESAFITCKKYEQEILKVLCMAYLRCNDKKKSDEWCSKLYELNPDYPAAAQHYAEYLMKFENYDLAEKILLECEKKCDYDPGLLITISRLYGKIEQQEKEKQYMEKMFALEPKTSLIYSNYGSYLMDHDQEELGLIYLKKSIELDPYDLEPYHDLMNYGISHNQQLAIEYTKKCNELYPHDGYNHYFLGRLQLQQLSYENAEINLKKSITLKNYDNIKSFSEYLLGIVYQSTRNNIKALRQYFKYCGYKKISLETYQYCIARSTTVCLKIANQKSIINTINEQEGRVVERFYDFALNSSLQPNLKLVYLNKLEDLRVILAILVYQKHIQTELTFKSQTQFWDLFIE